MYRKKDSELIGVLFFCFYYKYNMKFKSWLVEDVKLLGADSINKDTIKSVLHGVVNGSIINIKKCRPLFADSLQENFLQDLWNREDRSKQESTKLVNKFIIDNPAFINQMKSLFGIEKDGNKVYHGGEGIVYPFVGTDASDMQMVKFIIAHGGGAEFKIANGMKGHHLVPVLHTFKLVHHNFDGYPLTLYGFVTKRLIATGIESYIANIQEIATEFEELIDSFESDVHDKTISWSAIPYEEPADASKIKIKKTEINKLFKNLQKSFAERSVSDQKTATELLNIIKTIYEKTGFIFGRDFSAGFGAISNIGITSKREIQPYDFGLSVAVSKKATEAATGFPTIELR